MDLNEFIIARQKIWINKSFGADLSITDHMAELSAHSYTNMWRELDRHTLYLFHNIHQPLADNPRELIKQTIIFRLFNRIDTYEHIQKYGISSLKTRKANFTNAYMRCTKLESIIEYASRLDEQLDYLIGCPLEKWGKNKTKIFSFGRFLTDQLIMDLDYLGSPLQNQGYRPKWGPGAKRGLELQEIKSVDGLDIPTNLLPKFNRQPIKPDTRLFEHALCEYYKYVSGTAKRRAYRPSGLVYDPLPPFWQAPEIV